MKKIAVLFLFISFGCNKRISEENLDILNGYWEIDEVRLPDGNSKDYTVNTSVDFIAVKDKKGYRKKVQPKFDGSYDTSDDADLFVITNHEDSFFLEYSGKGTQNLMTQRTEELITLSEQQFSVRNLEGFTYKYKRFKNINIQK